MTFAFIVPETPTRTSAAGGIMGGPISHAERQVTAKLQSQSSSGSIPLLGWGRAFAFCVRVAGQHEAEAPNRRFRHAPDVVSRL